MVQVDNLVNAPRKLQARILADAVLVNAKHPTKGRKLPLLNYLVDNMPATDVEEQTTDRLTREKLRNAARAASDANYANKRAILRNALLEFFRKDPLGRILPLALEVEYPRVNSPLIDCVLRVVPNPHCRATSKIWLPHLQNDGTGFDNAMLVGTEPIVFWDDEFRCYIRLLDLNANVSNRKALDAAIEEYIAEQSGGKNPYADRMKRKKLTPIYHYESSGEVEGARVMSKYLSGFSRQLNAVREFPLVQTLSRNVALQAILEHSTILFGNIRTNHLIGELQQLESESTGFERPPYSVDSSSIHDSRHKANRYRDGPQSDGTKKVFCLVTRWQWSKHTTTVFGANNGRSIAAAVSLLTNEDEDVILNQRLIHDQLVAPRLFQLICSTTFEDPLQVTFGKAKIEDCWIPKPSGSTV